MERRVAVGGLSKMGDPRAIPHLIEALFKGWNSAWQPDTENTILQAIQQLHGTHEMVNPLIEQLRQPSQMKGSVIHLLGEIGDRRAVEPLRQALSTADEQMRLLIEQAIEKIQNS